MHTIVFTISYLYNSSIIFEYVKPNRYVSVWDFTIWPTCYTNALCLLGLYNNNMVNLLRGHQIAIQVIDMAFGWHPSVCSPANTTHLYNFCTTTGQRRRHYINMSSQTNSEILFKMLVIIRWAWQHHLNNTGDISDYQNSFKTLSLLYSAY